MLPSTMRRLIKRTVCGILGLAPPGNFDPRPRKLQVATADQAEFVICDQAIDITYVPTWEGWLSLAVLLDAHSRRVVGWAMADHLRTELALEALQMALAARQPTAGLVHHTDRGCQNTAGTYREALAARAIAVSMSRAGDCYDNAMAESFFATLKAELVDTRPWPTRRAARQAVFEWMEVFYNRQRSHSALGYRSPVAFELALAGEAQVA